MKFLLVLIIPLLVVLFFIQRYNIEYYKAYGRTAEEISQWLKTRKWYHAFVNNVRDELIAAYCDNGICDKETQRIIEGKVKYILDGNLDKGTISQAFAWMDTKEGTKYWGRREYWFLKWYFGQYIDFHFFRS